MHGLGGPQLPHDHGAALDAASHYDEQVVTARSTNDNQHIVHSLVDALSQKIRLAPMRLLIAGEGLEAERMDDWNKDNDMGLKAQRNSSNKFLRQQCSTEGVL